MVHIGPAHLLLRPCLGCSSAGAPKQRCRLQALQHRADTKLYRILTPQTPIARTRLYDRHAMDEFPNGTNMMVAVIAYTCAHGCLV